MIENLNGIHETVNYKDGSNIRLYENDEYEEYPKHWHTCIEIIMPTVNPYKMTIDGISYDLKVGDVILICPGALHHLMACPGERLIFQAELVAPLPIKSIEMVLGLIYPAVLITPDNSPDIYQDIHDLMLEIRKEYSLSAPLYEAAIYAKVLEMIVLIRRDRSDLQRQIATRDSKQEEYIVKFTRICDYISEHCCEDLTLESVAEMTGFSKFHFTRLFKQITNVSFYKFLNQKRIDHAASLLINPEISVTEAALSAGYSSLSSFIRMFKIIKGCTPTEYRAMYNL